MSDNAKQFDELIGQPELLDFYGVDNNRFKLGAQTFEAVENEDDGYRSYLETIKVAVTPDDIFHGASIARVRVERDPFSDNDAWRLIDGDEHVWLRVGTNNADDYYPWFVFEYTPKAPQLAQES